MNEMWIHLAAAVEQTGTGVAPDMEGVNVVRSVILAVLGGTLLLLAIRRLRRYRLKERYALLFVLSGMPFLVLAIWPGAILLLGRLLHMEYFTVMLLCVSTFLILMVFELLSIVSQQDQKIATLAQMVGILMEKQKHLTPGAQQNASAEAQHVDAEQAATTESAGASSNGEAGVTPGASGAGMPPGTNGPSAGGASVPSPGTAGGSIATGKKSDTPRRVRNVVGGAK